MLNSFLLCDFPTTFNGHNVNCDYRTGLRYHRAVADPDLEERDKLEIILSCFFGDGSQFKKEEVPQIWPFIEYFISCGEKDKDDEPAYEPVFDYTQDAKYIYAAFYQVYRIDLRTEKMHWWKFQALLTGLPQGTFLSGIIDIRSKKIPDKAKPEYKREIRKLKKRFEINHAAAAGNSEKIIESQNRKVLNFFERW